jgi:hypothetical protein
MVNPDNPIFREKSHPVCGSCKKVMGCVDYDAIGEIGDGWFCVNPDCPEYSDQKSALPEHQ